MQVARWALTCVALLAAFQAWLWAGQDSLLALAGSIALALALLAVAFRPGTRLARVLGREWVLPRTAGESQRRYRFKIAMAWLLVVALCVVGCIAIRGNTTLVLTGVALRVFGFVALLMAFQSLLAGLFRSSSRVCERIPMTRESRAVEIRARHRLQPGAPHECIDAASASVCSRQRRAGFWRL